MSDITQPKVIWRDPERMTAGNLSDLQARFNEHTRQLAAVAAYPGYGFRQRFMFGVDQRESGFRLTHGHQHYYDGRQIPASTATHARAGAINCHLNHTCVTVPVAQLAQPKETQMIDKKQFVAQPVKTPVASLAKRHAGSLVTITTEDGVEITDILDGVASRHNWEKVDVYLQNIEANGSERYFDLAPKSVVLVRRPRPVPVAKKTTRR